MRARNTAAKDAEKYFQTATATTAKDGQRHASEQSNRTASFLPGQAEQSPSVGPKGLGAAPLSASSSGIAGNMSRVSFVGSILTSLGSDWIDDQSSPA